jgi:hypothetical protein
MKCRGPNCKIDIIWGWDDVTKKKIPLDTRAPVYRVVDSNPSSGMVLVERMKDCYVTHFATCVDAPQFSASKKGNTS